MNLDDHVVLPSYRKHVIPQRTSDTNQSMAATVLEDRLHSLYATFHASWLPASLLLRMHRNSREEALLELPAELTPALRLRERFRDFQAKIPVLILGEGREFGNSSHTLDQGEEAWMNLRRVPHYFHR